MSTIFVTGHRNPDMDSIAAAISYSALKNELDSGNHYIPVALGPLNTQSHAMLESLGLPDPLFVKDVYSRVSAVYRKPTLTVAPDDPVYELVNMYNQNNPSVVPIMDGSVFKGLLSIDEINRYFLRENMDSRPVYDILLKNIPRVIKGFFLKKCSQDMVHGPIMVGAMDYKVFCHRLAGCPEKPILVVGNRQDHIRAAFKEQLPGIILTGMDEDSLQSIDTSEYDGFVYVSHEDTAETIRLLRLSVAVAGLLVRHSGIRVTDDMLFESAKGMLLDSGVRGLPVFSHEDGSFVGFITRRCFLTQPRQKLIMVDHNEAMQSVQGIEDAEIIEILDHHRLSPPRMRTPIYIVSEPLGSTCTIVYEQFRKWGVEIDPLTALVLLSGLTADTVMLKSPTTTDYDRHVARKLCEIGEVPDFEEFGRSLFEDGSSLSERNPDEVICSDMKTYNEKGVKFAIGQVEVMALEEVRDIREKYLEALEKIRNEQGLNWVMLLISDVLKGNSVLLMTSYNKESTLIYEKIADGTYLLPGVLSRKKQLLPEILRVLEA